MVSNNFWPNKTLWWQQRHHYAKQKHVYGTSNLYIRHYTCTDVHDVYDNLIQENVFRGIVNICIVLMHANVVDRLPKIFYVV